MNENENEKTEPQWLEEKTIGIYPIHRKVLIVARQRIEGAWKAYVTPVPGRNHREEVYLWETEGVELNETQAKVFFPHVDLPYAR